MSWLADQPADPAAVLARVGVNPDEVTAAAKTGLGAAGPEIVVVVKRMLALAHPLQPITIAALLQRSDPR